LQSGAFSFDNLSAEETESKIKMKIRIRKMIKSRIRSKSRTPFPIRSFSCSSS